ncbi:MAG: D-sedoheptulose-7-phosphate isomerase [Terriglobales bacterium]
MNPTQYFEQLAAAQSRLPIADIERLAGLLRQAQMAGRTVFTFGNGGSAALAAHMVCDLAKGTAQAGGPRLRMRSLVGNIPLLTAWANDTEYAAIFAEQLANEGQLGDMVLAISCSGNSPNVLRGLERARELGMTTAALGGYAGGRMRALCDCCVVVPSDHMQIIEDMHHAIGHALYLALASADVRRNAAAAGLGAR